MAESAAVAEAVIAELKKDISDLDEDVGELSGMERTASEYETKARMIAEVITQALVKLDSVQISKDAAADALRAGDRKTSMKFSVLLARRKTIIKKLNALGDEVDKLSHGVQAEDADEE